MEKRTEPQWPARSDDDIVIDDAVYSPLSVDREVLLLSIKKLTDAFDEFIAICIDESGKPKAPSQKDLMRARACLPPQCKMALNTKRK